MLLDIAILVLCLLWALVCLRFYTLISRENLWQRRFIAIGAGLGAGLIWLLGSMILAWLRPAEPPTAPPLESADEVRIRPAR